MKYHIITFGCQMNKSDSERIARVIEKMGYQQTPDINKADIVVVNMCSVRQSAVNRVYGLVPRLKKLKEKNKKLKTILTGCITKEDKEKLSKFFDLLINITDLLDLPKKIHPRKSLQASQIKKEKVESYLDIAPKYQSNLLAFVPISTGCNNFCTYCVVPFTRGPLFCRDHQKILKEVKEAIKNGYKEIWLLGQNVNDYQSPTNPSINFAKLIKMVNEIPGRFKFFFTSPHPKNFSDELIDVLAKCEKFGKYINLPVQSGDNEILKKMNRNYTVEEYKKLIRKIRKKIPNLKISTDIIVGFPGESKKQFQNTVKLVKEVKFNWAYIAKYSPRPGTAAYKMKDNVPLQEKKEREKILRKIVKNE